MFDFEDQTTNEYKSFVKYVDSNTNEPYNSEYVKTNTIQLEYGYAPKFDKTLFFSLEKEGFLSNDECSYLINSAVSQNKWLKGSQTMPFWSDRTTPLFNLVLGESLFEFLATPGIGDLLDVSQNRIPGV